MAIERKILIQTSPQVITSKSSKSGAGWLAPRRFTTRKRPRSCVTRHRSWSNARSGVQKRPRWNPTSPWKNGWMKTSMSLGLKEFKGTIMIQSENMGELYLPIFSFIHFDYWHSCCISLLNSNVELGVRWIKESCPWNRYDTKVRRRLETELRDFVKSGVGRMSRVGSHEAVPCCTRMYQVTAVKTMLGQFMKFMIRSAMLIPIWISLVVEPSDCTGHSPHTLGETCHQINLTKTTIHDTKTQIRRAGWAASFPSRFRGRLTTRSGKIIMNWHELAS